MTVKFEEKEALFESTPKCLDGSNIHQWVEQWSGIKCKNCHVGECF